SIHPHEAETERSNEQIQDKSMLMIKRSQCVYGRCHWLWSIKIQRSSGAFRALDGQLLQ
ncbi:unnamed protein product, partial [Musa acuminata subsp. burmannicoides]